MMFSRVHRWSSSELKAAAALAVLALAGSGSALGSSSGPPDGVAGDPPLFNTCIACHSSFPLNSGPGALAITGLPSAYVPDAVYALSVDLTDPTKSRWGFELTAIRVDNELQAGTLAPENPTLVQVSAGPGDQRDYIKHRLAGTFPGQPGGASWGILWTAPPAGTGSVSFYVAGNAANNNGLATGDYVYAVSNEIPELDAAFVQDLRHSPSPLSLQIQPNPVGSTGAWIRYDAPGPGPADLYILDAQGRIVRQFFFVASTPGQRLLHWDGRGDRGESLPSGIFFATLRSAGRSGSTRFIVIK